jgi:1-acyl-sn-glycerol-3-phosphate acyltransferase
MYNFFKYGLFRPVVAWLFRARLVGEENVPATGGAIVAANHIATGETYVVPAMLSRPMVYPAKAELFKGDRGPGSAVVAWFLKSVGMVPLDRSGGRVSLSGLEPILDALKAGGLVGIYPEGTRSPDGRLYKGRTGVARMALAAGVPIIPVGVAHTETVKKFGFLPWIDHPVITVGRPLDFSAYAGQHDDRATLRWITDEVMAAIQVITGQDYVEAYGSSVKSGSMTLEEADARVLPRPGLGATPPALPDRELS